jgi:hypothetical protein
MMAAVIPLPHVLVAPISPAELACRRLSSFSIPPIESLILLHRSVCDFKVVYVASGEVGWGCVSTRVEKGSDVEDGMCPEGRPGRGSGALPVNLSKGNKSAYPSSSFSSLDHETHLT